MFLQSRIKIQGLSSVLIALFLCFLPARQVCAQSEYGDAFVTGSIADARTLIPILASDAASSGITGMIFNGLVKYDKDIKLTGDLAENWDIEEGGVVIVFHLRKNVFWHDGYPFTAQDVEFTYKKLIDPVVKTPYSGDFERVKAFEVIDDHTVKITYKEPFVPGLASWGMSIIPKHLLEKEDLNRTAFQRKPIGTGPYRFKAWKPQEKIELESYARYFEHRPFIDRYVSRVIPDESTMFLELQTQGLDSSELTPLQFKRQTDTGFFQEQYRKFRLPSHTFVYLGYNLNNSKFKDKRVRQALNYAVNKQEMIDLVLLGLGRATTGPFLPESWAYNNEVKPVPFDKEKAVSLLREAGWMDTNRDGWLDKDGELFEFTIITNQGNEERIKVAEVIQRSLKEVGIRVKIKVIEWSVFITEYINKKKFEAVLLGWSLPLEPDNYDIWHSSKTKEGEFNFIGYKNDEVDNLLIEGRRNFDQAKREDCYHRIHRILYEEQPYMFLYVPDSLSVLHRRFEGVKPAPLGIGYNFIDWWVPVSKQKYQKVTMEP